MDAREKLNEFANLRGWDKNKLIGWSECADFADWFVGLRFPAEEGDLEDLEINAADMAKKIVGAFRFSNPQRLEMQHDAERMAAICARLIQKEHEGPLIRTWLFWEEVKAFINFMGPDAR